METLREGPSKEDFLLHGVRSGGTKYTPVCVLLLRSGLSATLHAPTPQLLQPTSSCNSPAAAP